MRKLKLLIMLCMVAIAASASKNIFLKPNADWASSNARFAAYVWVGEGDAKQEAWYDFAAADEEGVYTVAVDDQYVNLIACRMNPDSENSWNNKWNQTSDINDFADYILVTITGWNDSQTTGEYTYSLDVTGLFLTNPSFETGDMTGWTNGGNSNDTGVKKNEGNYTTTNCDGTYVYNTWWQGTPLNQTVANLPAGSYVLSAVLASSDGNSDGKVFLKVGDTKELFSFPVNTGGVGVRCELPFTQAAEGSATITVVGASAAGEYVEAGHWWYKADDFHLNYIVEKGVIPTAILTYLSSAYTDAKTAAQNALDDEAYSIITGVERSNLVELLATEIEQTPKALNAAATVIEEATLTFTNAKADYQKLIDTKVFADVDAYKYANESKKEAVESAKNVTDPTSAADAVSKAEAIMKVYRQYAESSAMLEGVEGAVDFTSSITNPKAESDIASPWSVVLGEGSGGSLGILGGEPWTDGDGNATHKYFDGGNWGAQAWDVTMKQDIKLPKGKYQLTVKSRANSDMKSFVLFAGEDKTEMQHISSSGGVFNFGWNDASVEFTLDEWSTVTIGVQGVSEKQYQWMSFSDFRLVSFDYAPTYTVAGAFKGTAEEAEEEASFFGTIWAADATANDMVKGEDGKYTFTKEGVELAAGTLSFKVVKDHSWESATYPESNYVINITEAGKYNIAVTFDGETVSASATNTQETFTVGEAKWATAVTHNAVDFTNAEGLTAYIATLEGTTVTLTKATKVPAGTPVVLNGVTAKADIIESAPEVEDNALTWYESYTVNDSYAFIYALTLGTDGKAKFARVNNGVSFTNKAVIELKQGSGARELNIVFANETTGINAIAAENAAENFYNMNGQRVAAPAKGLYIVNGKKVVLK